MPKSIRFALIAAAALIGLSLYFWIVGSFLFTALAGWQEQVLSLATLLEYAQHGTRSERRCLFGAFAISLAFPALMVFGLLYKPRKLHGDARFANEPEIRKTGLRADVGVILGRKGRYLIAPNPGNVLGCAPPGGGKGVGWVIPTLLQWPDSVFVIDAKHENFHNTAGFRATHGQRVVMFDPLSWSSDGFGAGSRYNVLGQLSKGLKRVDEVDRIANFLIPDPLSGDPYWSQAARMLFKGIVLYLAEMRDRFEEDPSQFEAPPDTVSMGSVFRFVFSAEDIQKHSKHAADRMREELGRSFLMKFATLAKKQADGVAGVLEGRIAPWANPALAAATEVSDFSLENLRKERTSIYFGVTPDNIARLAPLMALMIQQAMDALTQRMPGKDEPYHVLFLLDEFAMLGRMPALAAAMAFLRGYGVRVMVILQSPAQLDEHYGAAGRRTMIDTFKYRMFYAPNDLETATTISKELGTYTAQTKSRSRPTGFGKSSSSVSLGSTARDLLMPQEVLQLPRDKVVIFSEAARPILAQKVTYYTDREQARRAAIPAPALGTYPIGGTAYLAAAASTRSLANFVDNDLEAAMQKIERETIKSALSDMAEAYGISDAEKDTIDELQRNLDFYSAQEIRP